MSWTIACSELRTHLRRARRERHAHRVLVRELTAYTVPGDHDELAALIDGRGDADDEAADLLARQTYLRLLRDSNPPLWPFAGAPDAAELRPRAR